MARQVSFPEEIYKNSPIHDLIIFAIYSIVNKNQKCTFEKLVQKCFDLFPKAFSFSRHSKWPDSRKLDRPIRTLRKRKLITGDPKTSFSLTKQGKKQALQIAQVFRQRKLL